MATVSEFLGAHRGLTRDQFLARVREPHLLVSGVTGEGEGFRTIRLQPPGSQHGAEERVQAVLPVKKRQDGNHFGLMVTLGRAGNNDLVIRDERVSKFHAYFRQQGPEWTLCDSNSTNGTTVNEQALPKERSIGLRSGDRIKLGGTIELTFLVPEQLHEWVQRQRA